MEPVSFGYVSGLFKSHTELSALMDELPIGIVVMDVERRILFYNRSFEALSGFSREDVLGVSNDVEESINYIKWK